MVLIGLMHKLDSEAFEEAEGRRSWVFY